MKNNDLKIREIVDRLMGAGPRLNLHLLLHFYCENKEEVPEPLIHEELVMFKEEILFILPKFVSK